MNLIDPRGLGVDEILQYLKCPTGRSCPAEALDFAIDVLTGGLKRIWGGLKGLFKGSRYAETAERRMRESLWRAAHDQWDRAEGLMRTSEGYRRGALDATREGGKNVVRGDGGVDYTLLTSVPDEPLVVLGAKLIPGVGTALEAFEALKACIPGFASFVAGL